MYTIVVIGGLVATMVFTSFGILTVLLAISVTVWFPELFTASGDMNI